jgi:hypothetical protein
VVVSYHRTSIDDVINDLRHSCFVSDVTGKGRDEGNHYEPTILFHAIENSICDISLVGNKCVTILDELCCARSAHFYTNHDECVNTTGAVEQSRTSIIVCSLT